MPGDNEKQLRTPAEARKASNLNMELVPPGFPMGPLPCKRDALAKHVNLFTTNVHTAGGGHSVSSCRVRYNKTIGDRAGVSCTQRPRKGGQHGCGWHIAYEETTEGWVLVHYAPHADAPHCPSANQHSHHLEASAAVMRATAHGRSIPPELADIMDVMNHAGSSVAEIDRVLEDRRRSLGLDRTWTKDDVYRQTASTAAEKSLDATNLLKQLDERKESTGLSYYARNNSNGVLSMVFVELKHGFEDWAVGGEENVLLFDPTWGTNNAGFKLCCFSTVSSTGQTVILAFALLMEETQLMFEWAFRCFADVFRDSTAHFLHSLMGITQLRKRLKP